MSTKLLLVALASAVLTCNAVAQTSVDSQTAASGSSQSSVSAGRNGAQASSNSSANASQSTQLTRGDSRSTQSNAAASGAAASSASANPHNANANLAGGTTMNAVLNKSVDSRHAKPGDEVSAKLSQDVKSNGKVVLPKNCKLVGHVTQAQARADGSAQSSLGVVFDHAVLKNGEQVPMNLSIQALAAAQSSTAASSALDQPIGGGAAMGGGGGGMVRGGGGGLLGGVGSTAGATGGLAGGAAGDLGHTAGSVVNTSAGVAGSATGNVGGALSATGQLTSQSSGVIGLHGLQLASQASNATQGSLITSTNKSVKLDSGTQMLLRVANQ